MSFGKIYGGAENPRTIAVRVAGKDAGLDLELVETKPHAENYDQVNPLGKIPAFVGANGFQLTECVAIAVFLASQNEQTIRLGKTKQDYASILRWLSFANQEIVPAAGSYVRPILGQDPQYNKKNVDTAFQTLLKLFKVLDSHLSTNTYLVGERITLADFFTAAASLRPFQYILDPKLRAEYPSLTRWFVTIVNQPVFSQIFSVTLCEELLKNVPPKKEKKEKESAPKEKAPAKEEEPPREAPKPKHPLAELGPSTLNLEDWKRFFANEETRESSLPHFWKIYNPEEYSLWRVEYKYNNELKLTFMSGNLIGGLFTRLEASRKYMFGSASVYGVNYDNIIRGAFLVRGQDAFPAFDAAPDRESYDYVKLDHTKEEDRKFVEDEWAWDTPAIIDGKTYEWATGHVLH